MTDSAPPPLQDSIDVRQLANAIRLLVFVVVIGLSLINMGVIGSIGNFEGIYHDMLGGKRLPLLTEWMLQGRVVLQAMAGVIPAVALGALLSRRIVAGIYVLSGVGFFAMLEAIMVYFALVMPLIQIIKAMGAGSGA